MTVIPLPLFYILKSGSMKMSAPNLPTIHTHTSESALAVLHDFLPYSIPIYRRLQFHLQTPSSHVLASFPPGTEKPPQCFCIAFLDRSRRPETEAWIFLSSEKPGQCSNSNKGPCPSCTGALLAIMAHISSLPMPAGKPDGEEANAPDNYTTHLQDPSIILLGTLHSKAAEILQSHSLIRMDLPGLDTPYQKFIFDTSRLPPAPSLASYRFAPVRPSDFALVRSRTAIPRRDRTLKILPSVALYDTTNSSGSEEAGDEAPIAWAFLGPDASLTSLHVEPEYRGRGLAKAVTNKLFTESMQSFGREALAHSDVALDNKESTGVALSLGGKPGWQVYWVRVDLTKAAEIVKW